MPDSLSNAAGGMYRLDSSPFHLFRLAKTSGLAKSPERLNMPCRLAQKGASFAHKNE